MRLGRRGVLGLAVSALARPALGSPALACGRVAALGLSFPEGYPVVTGMLAGRPVSWIVDTGAEGMLVVPAVARALGLPGRGMTPVDGTGRRTVARTVALPGLRLGGAAMPDQVAPVVALPGVLGGVDPPFAGLLGASLLSRFDVEFDVLGRQVTLWEAAGCAPPMTGTVLPMRRTPGGEVFVPVRVNERAVLAMVDTGTRATLLDAATARALGLHPPVSANTAPGVDGARLPVGHTTVRFGLGDEAVEEIPVSVAPVRLDVGGMLLGLDQLSRRRFWLGYATGLAVFAER